MSTIKSSNEHLTLNADGSSKDIKFQANGVEKASISSAGAFTSTTIDATKLTGNLPAINGSALTNLPAATPSIDDNGDATAITIDSSEKVGIGTSSPARLLSLYGDTGIALQNSTTGTGTGNGTHIWVNSEGSGELLIQNRENSDIEFLTNDTERMRILAGGGLTFNGDTAAANALDDYEEGTFTPTLYGSLTAGSPTYSLQLGYYTKVGNVVHCYIRMHTTSIGTLDGQVRIGALPFTSANTSDAFSSVHCGYGAGLNMTAGNSMTGWIANNSTYIRLTKWNQAAGTGYLDDAEWSGTGNVMLSFTYHTD